MRIRKKYNSFSHITNAAPNRSRNFELEKSALEHIDKIEDRIIQTNIMFILGLTFLNAVYIIYLKDYCTTIS